VTWVIVLILAVVLVVVLLSALDDADLPEPTVEDDPLATEVAIALHDIRRRLDVAWVRSELRRDHVQLRRELAEELRAADIAAGRDDGEELS
jgi:hypothetical protein